MTQFGAAPHEKGAPRFLASPRCGAKNRRGLPCQCPAMRDKRRCRLHGGLSTGPRTSEGINRIKVARTIHGHYSKEKLEERRQVRALFRETRRILMAMSNEERFE